MNAFRLVPFCLLFVACHSAPIGYEAKPEDPLDGYKGTYAEAGVNTEVALGPKQEYLLSGYKTLQDDNARLARENQSLQQKVRELEGNFGRESETLQRERALRTQAEAEVAALQQKRRELEARILSLGIEKAKLEQATILAKIAELQRTLETVPGNGPAAAPSGGHQ